MTYSEQYVAELTRHWKEALEEVNRLQVIIAEKDSAIAEQDAIIQRQDAEIERLRGMS